MRWRRCLILAASLSLLGVSPVMPTSPAQAYSITVPNSSFEQSTGGIPDQWTLDPPPRAQSAAVSDAHAHSGSYALRVDDPADNSVLMRSATIPAEAGEHYTAGGWVYTETGDAAWLYLEFRNASGGRISEVHTTPDAAAEWRQVTAEATAPAGTTGVSIAIYGSGSMAGVSYYDDITLDGPEPEPYDPALGTQTELFVDDYRVASTTKVSRVTHAATKVGPVLRPDKPWESNNAYVYGTAIYDEQAHVYKLWYQAYNRTNGQYYTCYATSHDGVHWTKPNLGIVEYEGSTANNIVGTMHSPSVLLDRRDPDPARRYKMFGMVYGSGYWVWFSPDGIRWTPSSRNPVLPDGDVANVSYDPANERFVVTTKHPHPAGRVVYVSYSTDFENWTEPRLILTADERDQYLAKANGLLETQVYGMPVAAYRGVYLGFPWMFQYGGAGEPGTAGDGPMDTQLAVSRDLEHWERPDRSVIIPRGVEGSFDSGMTFTSTNLIVRGREVWLYYGGWDGLHGSRTRGASIGIAKWRLDGFVSYVNGGDQEGTVTTRTITFSGSKLHVNAALRPGDGALRVEVLGADGNPLPGFSRAESIPVRGDHTDAVVRWTSGRTLAGIAGQPVQIRFYLDGGDLYSYRIS